jgi:hypothetical protein
MSDQVEMTTVNAEDYFADMDSEIKDEEQPEGEVEEQQEGEEVEAEEQTEEDAETEEQPAEAYRVIVKDENGQDVEKELTLEELAQGYMLSSDYTRKRQEESAKVRQIEHSYTETLRQDRAQTAEVIDQLKAYVIQSIAPELNQLNPQLAATDPAEYVRLQAKQYEVQNMLNQLDQHKQAQVAQAKQAEEYQRNLFLQQCHEYVNQAVPEFKNQEYKAQLIDFATNTYGIPANELAYLANAPMFKDGGYLDSGKVMKVLNDAMKWNQLQSQKPMAQKKLTEAPKVIKPAAPKPRTTHKEDLSRLKKGDRYAADRILAQL